MQLVKILLVEDDPDWQKIICESLAKETDMQVTGTAAARAEAVEQARQTCFDIVLMDINLPGDILDGIYAALEISEVCSCKVIMLTSFDSEEIIAKSFAAGAVDYISKMEYRKLAGTIREVYQHTSPTEVLSQRYRALHREMLLNRLSPAERDVFSLIQKGYSQLQIQAKLFKSKQTVKNQINSILRKFGVNSSKEAVEKIRRNGL